MSVETVSQAPPDEPDPLAGPLAGEPAAPPEPSPGPEPRRYPSTIGGAFYLLILVAMTVGVVVAAADDWRVGVRILAAALGVAAALRLVLPQRDAGMLAVRHRALDVVLLAGLAAALWWLTGSIPDQPPT